MCSLLCLSQTLREDSFPAIMSVRAPITLERGTPTTFVFWADTKFKIYNGSEPEYYYHKTNFQNSEINLNYYPVIIITVVFTKLFNFSSLTL